MERKGKRAGKAAEGREGRCGASDNRRVGPVVARGVLGCPDEVPRVPLGVGVGLRKKKREKRVRHPLNRLLSHEP